jgi:hypothetical protein
MIKLLDLLKEDNPFVPRGSKEEREKDFKRAIQTQIQQYVKDGMEGDLDLADISITSLPSSLTKVGGNLNLYFTPITTLPDNLTKIGGFANLNRTKITKLPDNLTVGDSLYLFRTPITTLPDNLTVERDLFLTDSSITSLPDNLTVERDLYLHGTPLSKNHSEAEIRAMVPNVKGEILT